MTTYTIGQNCQITLQHPDINGGEPYGFLITGQDKDYGPAISVQHEKTTDDGTKIKIFFCVLLADNLANPDGSLHTDTRAEMYSKILDYLNQSEGLTLATPGTVFAGVGAVGFTATETHYESLTLITCQLNNIGQYYPAPNPIAYVQSLWDGSLTWATSYWR